MAQIVDGRSVDSRKLVGAVVHIIPTVDEQIGDLFPDPCVDAEGISFGVVEQDGAGVVDIDGATGAQIGEGVVGALGAPQYQKAKPENPSVEGCFHVI